MPTVFLKFHKLLFLLLKWIFKNKIIIQFLDAKPKKILWFFFHDQIILFVGIKKSKVTLELPTRNF
jgi:hypothetical protein